MKQVTGILVLVLLGCGGKHDVPPDARDISFEFHATAGWYIGTTPNVTNMTINGQPLASGAPYEIDVHFPSFVDSMATFAPLTVVITTTTDQRSFYLSVGQCQQVSNVDCINSPPPAGCPEAVIREDDQFYALPDLTGHASVDFFADCGTCSFERGHTQGWCARTR